MKLKRLKEELKIMSVEGLVNLKADTERQLRIMKEALAVFPHTSPLGRLSISYNVRYNEDALIAIDKELQIRDYKD